MPTRRHVVSGGASALAASLLPWPAAASPLDVLVLTGPPAPPTLYLAHLAREASLAVHARSIRLEQWKSPDQLRAGVISGNYHVAAVPVNVAANLYGKGVPVRLLDVTVWGILSVLTVDESVSSIASLGGREIVVPFRGDMPDIVLGALLRKAGLAPGQDVKVTYVGSPFEAVQLLVSRRIATVLLPEPAATAALVRGAQMGLPVRKAIDLQEAWAAAMGGPPRFPQAGTIVQARLAEERPALVRALGENVRKAVEWINADRAGAARLGAEAFKLDFEIVHRSLAATRMEAVPAGAARGDIERFFSVLASVDPATIGGRLPDARFYLG